MSEALSGNILVAQSGGPTTVINSSLAGVISEALNHECIEEIYGGMNGALGLLNEAFIDLAEESQQTIRALRYTPGAALGSSRYKLRRETDFERILDVFKQHNIRYFLYIGGNDSMDTAHKLSDHAAAIGYDLRVIGIPKTIDNDLMGTDHCPGYGSVIKHIAAVVRQMSKDHESSTPQSLVSIVEVMGRNAGWIAAGAALAKGRGSQQEEAPHLIYMPEVVFNQEKFLEDVHNALVKNRFCMIVASEGLVDANGNYLAANTTNTDAFGHAALGGVGETLRALIEENMQVQARSCKLGIEQRSAACHISKTDSDEAYMCGVDAVRAAVAGETGKMVSIVRKSGDFYDSETVLTDLENAANGVKTFPEDWINENQTSVSPQFVKYALPLIQGEMEIPYEYGLPKFARMSYNYVQKQLGSYAVL